MPLYPHRVTASIFFPPLVAPLETLTAGLSVSPAWPWEQLCAPLGVRTTPAGHELQCHHVLGLASSDGLPGAAEQPRAAVPTGDVHDPVPSSFPAGGPCSESHRAQPPYADL